jgi:hypothetical protein
VTARAVPRSRKFPESYRAIAIDLLEREQAVRALPNIPELAAVARRTVWFQAPEEALADPEHLIAHVLTYGTHEDVRTLRRYVSDDELALALEHAPPGIFDARSWPYWNLKIGGRYPAPPMPARRF